MNIIKKFKLDVWISIFLFIISIFLLNIASGFPKTTALFPKIILYSIVVLSIMVFLESLKKTLSKKENMSINISAIKNAFSIYVFILIYFLFLKPLGFLIATLLFCIVASWFLGSKSILKNLMVGLVFNIFVYFAFVLFLSVPIPLLPSLF